MDEKTMCMFCRHMRTGRKGGETGLMCGLTGCTVEANRTCGCGEKYGLLRPEEARKKERRHDG